MKMRLWKEMMKRDSIKNMTNHLVTTIKFWKEEKKPAGNNVSYKNP